MKNILLLITILFFSLIIFAQSNPFKIALIPQPVSIHVTDGSFLLPQNIVIGSDSNEEGVQKVINQFKAIINTSTELNILNTGTTTTVSFNILKIPDETITSEGYKLTVTSSGISIFANQPAGLFYGMQTLLQLFPPEILSKKKVHIVKWEIPLVEITDYPRFGWRGLLLDVARHFFTVQEVKDFIDQMAAYKYNRLHLHLTDDQGWRLQIKSLPELTEIGAWRAKRVGRWGEWTKPAPDEPKTYGGYYTHEDIKELVEYAKQRHVEILPEIDVPGHSMALLASIPGLSCTPGTYQVNAGDRFMIWEGGGRFYGLIDNNLCPANEKVYEVLDKVFTEVAQLFPFAYIHMGGDETYKGFWEKSDAIKQLMKKEKLKDMHEVQSYFVKRVGRIIESKDKKMMGWDEILEGGLAPNAAVMSWRGEKGGIEAAKMNHPVVMTPNSHTYVDLYQGDPVAEPPTYSMLRLNQSYKFDPLPKGIDQKLILGGQANLWSERLNTFRSAQYMLWPRAFAVAESVWSQPQSKDWNSFVSRTEKHFERFDVAQIKYSRSMYDPIFTFSRDADSTIIINLKTEVEGLNIHYSFDETFPDQFYPAYNEPLRLPKDAANLWVVTYRGNQQVGKQIKMPVEEMKKRIRK
ncbi:MAG: family 20 glycosylhydrolase [Chitinophagaceae bacterium]|nr:family 20 glycosylhydrolase [Chitinophagaceae bacterium]